MLVRLPGLFLARPAGFRARNQALEQKKTLYISPWFSRWCVESHIRVSVGAFGISRLNASIGPTCTNLFHCFVQVDY